MTTPQHVIFGTGAIGLATFEALRRRGETVRLVNRSGHARVPDDVEVIGGDARDPGFTTTVAQGARVLYQTLNPPYPEWTAQFPALQSGEHPDAPGQVWHVPNDPDTRTTRQLVDIVYRHVGQPRTKLRAMPPLMLRALGLINPIVRELLEMHTSSRNRSSWTAARSRASSAFTPPRSIKPWTAP
jgi:hypothetical protein